MSIQLIRHLQDIPQAAKNSVVTIGNFDGVHRGHQALIACLAERAKNLNTKSVLVTFEPLPVEFFSRDALTVARLTRLREKFHALQKLNLDYVLLLRFNEKLASLSALDFVKQVLVDGLAAKHILIGDDFRFGFQRQGDLHFLVEHGKQLGFTAEALSAVTDKNERISSTRVRQALKMADFTLSTELLGRPYIIEGRVEHGDQIGTTLNCPTANIGLHRRLSPLHGIYTVWVAGVQDQPLPGVASIGSRPAVGGDKMLLEVHLLDFQGNLYGKHLSVQFCQKLRDEENYPTIVALQAQIEKDVLAAKKYFKRQNNG